MRRSLRARKREASAVIGRVAAKLGNTPAVCRRCYVHPEILASYMDGALALGLDEGEDEGGLEPEERAVLAHLRERLGRAA